ncbi:MAG: formylglycine-generating enzyme family protein [Bacteroidales bacterium]|nr:formylglycine-generating enzyme family protein [Bacteroidales bacterium]
MRKMNRLSLIAATLICLSLTSQAQPQMVKVEGGTFAMGNPGSKAPKGDVDERPVHNVNLKDFYIGKYEVTVKEYKEFINDKSKDYFINKRGTHQMPAPPDSTWLAEHPDTKKYYPLPTQKWWGWVDDYPMHHITWFDAVAFCNWLSDKYNLEKCYFENEDGGIECDLSKNGYRLPTEAEWEYAARGGQKSNNTVYAGSNNPIDVCWFDDTSKMKGPQKVGTKSANELGIYDMCGNVWEWCTDFYAKDFYSRSPKNNPVNETITSYRVLRGGSWHYHADYATLTSRDGPEPSFTNYNYGMRLAKSAN